MYLDIMFSIVIPLFNKEKYINQTICSILNQTYSNFEIIIIDDCSIDASRYIVQNIISRTQNKNIRFIQNEKNQGVAYSRNRGIEQSVGKYIIFLDADDEISNMNFLGNVSTYIEKYNPEYIMTTRNYYGKYLKPKFRYLVNYLEFIEKDFYKISDKKNVILKGNFPFGGSASAIISRSMIADHRFNINESYFEDWYYFLNIFLKADVYYYRSDSIKINYDVASVSKNISQDFVTVIPQVYLLLSENSEHTKLRKTFFWFWMQSIIGKKFDKKRIENILILYRKMMIENFVINKRSIFSLFIIMGSKYMIYEKGKL